MVRPRRVGRPVVAPYAPKGRRAPLVRPPVVVRPVQQAQPKRRVVLVEPWKAPRAEADEQRFVVKRVPAWAPPAVPEPLLPRDA